MARDTVKDFYDLIDNTVTDPKERKAFGLDHEFSTCDNGVDVHLTRKELDVLNRLADALYLPGVFASTGLTNKDGKRLRNAFEGIRVAADSIL